MLASRGYHRQTWTGASRIDSSATAASGSTWLARAGLYLLAWVLVGVLAGSQALLTYAAAGDRTSPRLVYGVTLSFWLPWALAGVLVLLAAHRFPLRRKGLYAAVAMHLALNALLAAGVITVYRTMRAGLGYPPRATFGVDYLRTLNTSVIVYWGLVALAELAAHQKRHRERERRAADLAARLQQAQLRALRAQLQPHFLFNTLNAIQAHLRDDPARADDMVAALAELLRSTLRDDVPAEVSVRDELDFIRRYLDLQQLRLGDRLLVHLDIETAAYEARFPFLMLQPLVENAIEHGVEGRRGPGRITIGGHIEGERLSLTVEDDGPGPGARRGKEGRGPLGLANIRERLRNLYGEQGGLRLEGREGGGTRVTVVVPFHRPAVAAGETGASWP